MRELQQQLTKGPLLDRAGQLVEAGWSTKPVRTYDRNAIRAPWHRIKEWDYYCILSKDFAIAPVIADNSYMGFLGLAWMDFRNKKTIEFGATPFLTRGKTGMPSSSETGDLVVSHPKISLSFKHSEGGRILSFCCPDFDKGGGLEGEIELRQPDMDSMVIATPFPEAPRAFYYNQKVNCMPASGSLRLSGQDYNFESDKDFGVLDWGRGVWTYKNTWYWGSASGINNDKPFGFNIGYGFGDTSAASENMIFYDGKAHKFDQVAFQIPRESFDEQPWRFSSSDGRFEMDFIPIVDRHSDTDLKIIRSRAHQVFGLFSGKVILDDGEVLQIDNLLGFAEEVLNLW
mgnify:CR=1 FL=1